MTLFAKMPDFTKVQADFFNTSKWLLIYIGIDNHLDFHKKPRYTPTKSAIPKKSVITF
jgi:hypothetical protein